MPRRTQKGNPKLKQQLQFIQAPIDGASHSYGPQVRGARNPKIFLSSEGQRQSVTAHSWVTPQFDTSMMSRALHPHKSRGKKKKCSKRSVLDSSSLLSMPQPRRTSVCKFPALTFEKHATAPPRPPAARYGEEAKLEGVLVEECASEPIDCGPSSNCNAETRPSGSSLREASVEDARELKLTPAIVESRREGGLDCNTGTPVRHQQRSFTDSGFTPPDIETPDVLQASGTCSATQETCLSKLRLLFPLTPLQAPPPPVLVSDTPEEHYGIDWRRRRLSFQWD